MSTTIHVKGSDLPAKWRKQANVAFDEQVRVTIEAEREAGDGLLPSEEDFRPEFIAEVEKSSQEVKDGLSVRLRSEKERKGFFDQIKNG